MKHVVLTLLAVALLLGFVLEAPAAVKYKVLHHFGSGNDGATPYGPLAFYGSKLYGVTIGGATAAEEAAGLFSDCRPTPAMRGRKQSSTTFQGVTIPTQVAARSSTVQAIFMAPWGATKAACSS